MGVSWLPSRDGDGDFMLRGKVTKPGRIFDQRVVEFTTSKLNSERSKRYDGADWGDVSLKFYNIEGVELVAGTQAELDAFCSITTMSWEPSYDYDLFGGELSTLSCPMNYENMLGARLWLVAVPFLPHPLGEIEMVGGRVLKGHPSTIKVDGKSGKGMVYDSIYHTNEIITHVEVANPGEQFRLEMVFEHYFERT